MILEPIPSGRNNEQYITADVPFWVCGWLNGDSELRSLTYEDEAIDPPNRVSSFIEIDHPINEGEKILQHGFGATSWEEFVEEIEARGKTIPPKPE